MAGTSRKNRKAILGKKLGMTQIFDEAGRWIPVTVLKAGPCTVLQVKTPERDGYTAVQLAFDDKRKSMKKPQQALFDSLDVSPKRIIREVPFVDEADLLGPEEIAAIDSAPGSEDQAALSPAEAESAPADADESEAVDEVEESEETESAEEEESEDAEDSGPAPTLEPGAQIGARTLNGLKNVDVRGVTKGRGFAGTTKRHGHSTGDKSHGGKSVRLPGSTGMHTDPGRVFKGRKMPGHYGHVNRKIRNLAVVHIDEKKNLLLVKGAVPGPNGGYVYIEESLS